MARSHIMFSSRTHATIAEPKIITTRTKTQDKDLMPSSTSTKTSGVVRIRPEEKTVDSMIVKKEELTPLAILSKGGPVLEGPRLFNDFETQRRWMLEHMAGAFRILARKGFNDGIGGHISMRDPEHPNCFWMNPLGRHFGLMKASDLILMNEQGKPIGGNTVLPCHAAGFQIHSHILSRYPHVKAACHTHSSNGRAWSNFGKRLDMLNQDVCVFHGDAHQVFLDFGGIVFNAEEGARLAATLGPNGKALILQNHGILTVGSTVDEAARLFVLMESSCEVQLKIEAAVAAGLEKQLISDNVAAATQKMIGDPDTLFCELQNEYEYELAKDDSFLR